MTMTDLGFLTTQDQHPVDIMLEDLSVYCEETIHLWRQGPHGVALQLQ